MAFILLFCAEKCLYGYLLYLFYKFCHVIIIHQHSDPASKPEIAAVTPTLKKHNADFTKYESF